MMLKKIIFFFLFFILPTSSSFSWQSNIAFKRVVAPYGLSYSTANPSYTKWTPITNNTATVRGTSPVTFSISPALPSGLSFSTTTGLISGTPTIKDIAGTTYTITATNGAGSVQVAMNLAVVLSPYTWMGTTSTNWHTGTNWLGGAAPSTNAHNAFFDDECGANDDAVISAAVTARSIQLKSNFNGTVTQSLGAGNTLSVGTNLDSTRGGISVDSGAFIGGNANIRADFVEANGGSFTATSAELRVGHVSGTQRAVQLLAAGVFNHNNGHLYLDSGGDNSCNRFFLDKVLPLYNFSFDCEDTNSDNAWNGAVSEFQGSVPTITVQNDLNFLDGAIRLGTIEYAGTDVSFACDSPVTRRYCAGERRSIDSSGTNWTVLRLQGATAQTYTYQDGAGIGFLLTINNASGVTPASSPGKLYLTALDITTGAFTAPAAELAVAENMDTSFESPTVTFRISAAGSFIHNSGTVAFRGDSGFNVGDFARIAPAASTLTFNNFILNHSRSKPYHYGKTLNISSGKTINILGDLRVADGRIASGGGTTLVIKGNYYRDCTDYESTDHPCADVDRGVNKTFDNPGSQLFYASNIDPDCQDCTMTINPGAGNTVTLSGRADWNWNGVGTPNGNLTVTSGTFHIASGASMILRNNLVINGAITCAAGEYIQYGGTLTGTPGAGNDTNCYRNTPTDATHSAVDWTDFSGFSGKQTFAGIKNAILVRISVANVVGAPNFRYRVNKDTANGNQINSIVPGSPVSIWMANNQQLEFQVWGTSADSGLFTVENASNANALIDSTTGTVP